MAEPARVLVLAHRTAATSALLDAIRERAGQGEVEFELIVPSTSHGLHRVVDPEEGGRDEAQKALDAALPKLSDAAGKQVGGRIGDPEPLSAIQDAINLGSFDEIIISTLPQRMSRWLRLDLVSKARGLGLPVTHVEAPEGEV
ncbi:MAG: hypothetical protein QOK31_1612 [Solirubrobacteraceae bacterium]|jgi:hypothetical protein|nr:hypothetical protein [Solirubrobacteraceae bacterium]